MAAITAGGRVGGDVAEALKTDIKALARIGGRRMIDASIDAARDAGASRIAVVGPQAVHDYCGARIDDALPESPSGEENLRRALGWAGDSGLLLLTSDLPFLRGAALAAFVERALPFDVAMPLASAADYDAAFPSAPEHAIVLGGERVASGSVFFFARGAAPRVTKVATHLFAARKSPIGMARLLGPALLTKFVLRRLRIADIEARAYAVFALRMCAVRNADPTLCFDVDTQADYAYARERLGRG